MDIDRDSPRVKFPPPLAFIGTLLLGLLIGRTLHLPKIPLKHGFESAFGWTAIVIGFAIILTANGLFRRAGTHARPWKTTSTIVTDGVYRWTRNPMYLGMALVYAGIALICDSLTTLLLLLPLLFVIQKEVIEVEEAYLEAKFGWRYLEYKSSVGRWFGTRSSSDSKGSPGRRG